MSQSDGNPENWERKVLEKLATSALMEQRRSRYWGIFFKSLTFLYLFLLLFIAAGWFGAREMTSPGKHTALVQVSGVIATFGAKAAPNRINAAGNPATTGRGSGLRDIR